MLYRNLKWTLFFLHHQDFSGLSTLLINLLCGQKIAHNFWEFKSYTKNGQKPVKTSPKIYSEQIQTLCFLG